MRENSRIVKNTLILYVRLLVTSVIGLIASRFILQALGVSDFGLYNVVGGIIFMLAFLNNVMVSTTYRYLAYELGSRDENLVNRIFNISLVIHILLALLIVIIAEVVGVYYITHFLNIASGKMDDALYVFHFSLFSTFISILSVPYQGLVTAMEKFSVIAGIEILKGFLYLSTVIFLLFYDGNRLRLYSVLMSIISSLPTILYFLYCRKGYPSLIVWNFQKGMAKYKEMLVFSFWIMFGAAANTGEMQGSALIINLFFGTILNASYGIANQVNNVVKTFSQNLNQAVIPQITKSFSVGNTERTMQLVIYSSKYSFMLMLLPALPILLETDFILKLWLKDVPQYTSIFIQYMIVNALISTSNAGIPAAVHATGKIMYFQIVLSTLSLLGLPISYFLLKFGFAPYYLLLTYTCIAVINFFVVQILLKRLINFNIKKFFFEAYLKMIKVLVAVSPLFFLRSLIESSMYRFLSFSFLSVFWLLAAVYLFGMGQEEKVIVKDIICKLVIRFRRKEGQVF